MTVISSVEEAAELYVWGFPLVAMHRTRARHPRDPANPLVVRDRLATAADRGVVAPNNDTLYTSGWFDLRAGDVTIDVRPMDPPDRYWSVMLLDAYTNVTYVCRRLHGRVGARARVTFDPLTRPRADVALDVVPIATPTVWLLARVVVDGPDDLQRARAAQARIRVSQEPDTDRAAPPSVGEQRDGADFYDELRAALTVDPPASWHPRPPSTLSTMLDDGIAPATRVAGAREGDRRIAATGLGPDRTANGWGTRSRGANFGDDVTYRAAFAKFSLAGHLPAENRSYTRGYDGSRSAVLRFPPRGEPPVKAFWSLCVYGPDLFFVENELDRYSIGDRTPGLRRDSDGSLSIEVGHERPSESSNWLPTPPGRCFLSLRAYEGRGEVVDATWFPPELVSTSVS